MHVGISACIGPQVKVIFIFELLLQYWLHRHAFDDGLPFLDHFCQVSGLKSRVEV